MPLGVSAGEQVVEITKEKDVVILQVTEDDLADPQRTSSVIEQLLREDGENKIVVDLSRVQNIYSLQIGTLVTIHVLCYENVAVMKLAGANQKLRELLRMVGLEALMEMHHGTGVAVESFGPPAGEQGVRRDGPLDPRVKR
ncbi:MAG: STAS domain-containing protein [Planctomycetota bacterium]|nr:STAS domain-containing protein [Planctomycetota bacterium]